MIASQLYYSVLDGATSEQSSRTAAMENASKNAGELVEALTLQYNKARQVSARSRRGRRRCRVCRRLPSTMLPRPTTPCPPPPCARLASLS